MKISKLITFISNLVNEKFTGRLILDFHCGDISCRIKKEITEVLQVEGK